MGKEYEIEVQYHQIQNITYVLLDAPIFRQQTKADPYPPRMDDIDSAIYYSAWNYCIAEAIRRFNPDLYHINDYHGAAAPLYLLPSEPSLVPSLSTTPSSRACGRCGPPRNPRRSARSSTLIPTLSRNTSSLAPSSTCSTRVPRISRVHQKGFGAVGVSKKYGDRSYARYPIFWGLSKIGQLPIPTPATPPSGLATRR